VTPVTRLTPEIRAKYTSRRGALSGGVGAVVDQILADFRKDPDGTIRALTKKFDKVDLPECEVSAKEVAEAEERLPQNVQVAIRTMYDSVVRYHKQDLAKSFEIQPIKGVSLGKQIVPFDRAGLYVPGGLAVYPSSVIMAAAPAVVAGVKQLILCTPPNEKGAIPDAVLWALEALPAALRDLRAEVRRTADMATDALAAAAHSGGAPSSAEGRPFDPLPAALRELREEVREAVDRATESLASTRKGMDALPAIVSLVRDEFEQLTGRLTEALTAANLEAARAFAMVAREVRTLGDRQAVLREEVRLLGKRFEEMERLRRRAQTRTAR